VMCLVMLLSACAVAECAEIILGDIVVSENETAILDLTGVDFRLGVCSGAGGV
jgi:hypothetical protein